MPRWGWRPARLAIAPIVLAGLATAAGADPPVRDLQGRAVDPLDSSAAGAVVLLFIGVDCPISNRYAPELQRLYEEYAADDVAFWLVYAGPSDSAASAVTHRREYGYRIPAVLDPARTLVDRAGVSVTPEAAVFDADRRVIYRGRIDDRYVAFGQARPRPTRRDLALVLDAIRDGEPVEPTTTRAIGCFIPDPR